MPACFPQEIADLLLNSGLSPTLLVLEFIETEPLELCRTVRRNLTLIAQMGVRLSIDDYGRGYATYPALVKYSTAV
ncbi:EAL domain-containing protein [Actinoallomurus sp. CA-150999]|uniref:EAL domain-containing protein n=1 Tax=Actinoallomurus sp. CA-150999 TaxID=3239887 RepID=UPI003D93DA00